MRVATVETKQSGGFICATFVKRPEIPYREYKAVMDFIDAMGIYEKAAVIRKAMAVEEGRDEGNYS